MKNKFKKYLTQANLLEEVAKFRESKAEQTNAVAEGNQAQEEEKKEEVSSVDDSSSSDDESSSDEDKSSGSSSGDQEGEDSELSEQIESEDDDEEDFEENMSLTLAERRKRWELPPHLLPVTHPRYKPLE